MILLHFSLSLKARFTLTRSDCNANIPNLYIDKLTSVLANYNDWYFRARAHSHTHPRTYLRTRPPTHARATTHSLALSLRHIAAQLGNIQVLCRLIDIGGANVNAIRAESGATPLIAAAQRGHANVVQKLLASGADLSIALLNSNATAIDVAKRHPLVMRVIQDTLQLRTENES